MSVMFTVVETQKHYEEGYCMMVEGVFLLPKYADFDSAMVNALADFEERQELITEYIADYIQYIEGRLESEKINPYSRKELEDDLQLHLNAYSKISNYKSVAAA